jgi:hypothetical protein
MPQLKGCSVIKLHAIVPASRRITLSALATLSCLVAPIAPPALATSTEQSDRATYVLLAPGSRSSSMSGSTEDLRRARALRSGSQGLLYVRYRGAGYVIRDTATLRQAEAIFAPLHALGARQAELGSRQAALGERQGRLGAKQGRLVVQQANASPRRAAELGRQQNALGRRQSELGEQQSVLGRQQDALGREQSRLARLADEKFAALLVDALRRGTAQRID